MIFWGRGGAKGVRGSSSRRHYICWNKFSVKGDQHPLPNCRLYYSQIDVDDTLTLKYDRENEAKRIVYRSVTSSICPNIKAGSNYSQLINAGIVYPIGILLVPFLSNSSAFGDVQWKSPFDSCINISFTNGGLLNIDVMVFIFYSDEFTIDIKNGLVQKYKK